MIRKPVFDAVRLLLGRGFRPAEIAALDQAFDDSDSESSIAPPPPRVIGSAGRALIRAWEGCAKLCADGTYAAYPDPGTGAAPWTIGWGATGSGIGPETRWTRAACDNRLDADLVHYATTTSENETR